MNHLPSPTAIAAHAVATLTGLTEAQRQEVMAVIERALVMQRRQINDAVQQELAGTQQGLAEVRRAIEAALHPKS